MIAGMADDPAATAATAATAAINNPELSTLVSAVGAANLVDTLNGDGPFTIFAPANSAFAAVPAADLDAALTDPTGLLTDILTIHVVAGQQLSSTDLAAIGTIDSIGGTLTVAAPVTPSPSTPAVARPRWCAPTSRRPTPPCTSSTPSCSPPADRRRSEPLNRRSHDSTGHLPNTSRAGGRSASRPPKRIVGALLDRHVEGDRAFGPARTGDLERRHTLAPVDDRPRRPVGQL